MASNAEGDKVEQETKSEEMEVKKEEEKKEEEQPKEEQKVEEEKKEEEKMELKKEEIVDVEEEKKEEEEEKKPENEEEDEEDFESAEEEDSDSQEDGEGKRRRRRRKSKDSLIQEKEEDESKVDDDEDRKNPQYIPKKGMFYEHDDRIDSDEEEEMREEQRKKRIAAKAENVSKWGHDKFRENDQAPKSSQELVQAYGYDIRDEENAPRPRRRRRYGRGPNKYDRNWEDEEAYSSGKAERPTPRAKRTQPGLKSEQEFPELGKPNGNSRKPGREAGSRGTGRNVGKESGREAGRESGREPGREAGRNAGRDSGRHSGRNTGRDTDRDTGRDTGRDPRRDTGRDSARETGSANARLVNQPRPVEKGRDLNRKIRGVEDQLANTSIDQRRPTQNNSNNSNNKTERIQQQQNDRTQRTTPTTTNKRYSNLRQPKGQDSPTHSSSSPRGSGPPGVQQTNKPANSGNRKQFYADKPSSPQNNSTGFAEFSPEALAAAFPSGHYPNGPPGGAPFINTTTAPIRVATTVPIVAPAHPPYINPAGMANYGPPPGVHPYTPVTVPISVPLVGVPHESFVTPPAPPPEQILLAAGAVPPPGGYVEVRGGVTYFHTNAQLMQRAVNKRPKAAIPIVDPSQMGSSNEEALENEHGVVAETVN